MLPKSWVGWVIYLAGGLVALVLGGTALLLFLLPRAQLKGEFETQLERAIGRDVAIGGELKVAFFPVLGFEAGDVRIANVQGGRAPQFAQARRVAAGVELIPYIFRRRIVVDRLVLVDPVIALELDREGRPNWNLAPAQPQARPQAGRVALQDLALKQLRISGGRITYIDLRDGDGWAVDSSNIRSAIESLDQPIKLEGAFMWRGERIELDATIARPRSAMRGQAVQVSADVRSGLLTAHAVGQLTAADESFSGDVRAEGPNLRRLAAWLGSPLAPGAGLEAFFVNGRLSLDRSRVAFENASLRLDELVGRGDFVLATHQSRPYVSGRLELQAFDVNPYLAPPPAQGAAAQTAQAAAASTLAQAVDARRPWSTAPLDFNALKAIDANLELYVRGLFKVQRVQTDNATLSMVLNNGYLAATLHRLSLYGGEGRGRLEVDARAPEVRLVQELTVEGVRAHEFLRDAFGFENLEGAANVTMNWTGRGASQDALISSLDGHASVQVREGAIRGVDLGGVARTIRNALSGDLVNPNARTRFNNLNGAFAIADGVMATDNFSVNIPDLRIDSVGVIDVGNQTMTMRITPREGGLAVPFVVRGPWARLDYNSDLRGRERAAIQRMVRQVKAQAPAAR